MHEIHKKWGSELINVVTKEREVDAALKHRIETRTLFICEQHFKQDQYYVYNTRKSFKDGELPKLNLPIKSFTTPTPVIASHRSTLSIKKRDEQTPNIFRISPPQSPQGWPSG